MNIVKKNLKLLVFLLVCLSIYIIYETKYEEKYNYISIGDGFSVGLNSYGNKDYGYNLYLRDYLKENNKLASYNCNFSYPEMTINDLKKDILLNATDKDNNNIKRTLREANLLTVSVGLNDLIYQLAVNKELDNNKKWSIIHNISGKTSDLIKEIQKYYKYDIYLIGYYNFYPQNSVENEMLDKLNQQYLGISKQKKVIFVDNKNVAQAKYLDNPNSMYPNIYGYRQIFNNILEKMEK